MKNRDIVAGVVVVGTVLGFSYHVMKTRQAQAAYGPAMKAFEAQQSAYNNARAWQCGVHHVCYAYRIGEPGLIRRDLLVRWTRLDVPLPAVPTPLQPFQQFWKQVNPDMQTVLLSWAKDVGFDANEAFQQMASGDYLCAIAPPIRPQVPQINWLVPTSVVVSVVGFSIFARLASL